MKKKRQTTNKIEENKINANKNVNTSKKVGRQNQQESASQAGKAHRHADTASNVVMGWNADNAIHEESVDRHADNATHEELVDRHADNATHKELVDRHADNASKEMMGEKADNASNEVMVDWQANKATNEKIMNEQKREKKETSKLIYAMLTEIQGDNR